MKAFLTAIAVVITVMFGLLVHEARAVCFGWQERYAKVMRAITVRNSPISYTFEAIERIIGELPAGCETPQLANHDPLR
jgi:hypothetical protein